MAIRNILKSDDDLLRKTSRPVTKFDKRLHILLDDMKETLAGVNGVGLAAPQVGVLRRVFIVSDGEKVIECINPEIISSDGEIEDVEGCLSIPGVFGYVARPQTVRIRAYDRDGNIFEAEGSEIMARAFCHETEHLDGKLFDRLITRPYDPEADKEEENP